MSASALRKFPLGISDWNTIHQQNLFFVDKTDKLINLLTPPPSVYCTRAPYMGKTLLMSMIRELLTNGDQNFAGTAIYGKWKEQRRYKVIYLSLQGLDCTSIESFEAGLRQRLITAYAEAGFTEAYQFADTTKTSTLFLQLSCLTHPNHHKLAFLIDEFEYPIACNFDNPQLCEAFHTGPLRRIQVWFHQEAERGARYILVMGTTNYRENARDHNEYLFDETFSSWQPFAAMLGYTQEELESNFAPYIELAAKRMHLSTADLLEQLKLRYGGFCIDEDLKYEMYNPRLINRFFAQVTSEEFNRDPQWQPQFLPLPEDEVPVRVALQSRLRAPQLTPSELDDETLWCYIPVYPISFTGQLQQFW